MEHPPPPAASPSPGSFWRVAGVSVCGTSHARTGKPCQDAHLWAELPEGWLVGAVADGAGSAALAEIGSLTAVQAAVESIRQQVSTGPAAPDDAQLRNWLETSFAAARYALEQEAVARSSPVRDFSTTLIVVLSSPALVAVLQIGDGATVVRSKDGPIIALTVPQITGYINETTFLTSSAAAAEQQFQLFRGGITELCAFSDGIQMLALKLPEVLPHPPFFQPLFKYIAESTAAETQEAILQFLTSEQVRRRTDDDLTLWLAHAQKGS